jgi:hypothetical protein
MLATHGVDEGSFVGKIDNFKVKKGRDLIKGDEKYILNE